MRATVHVKEQQVLQQVLPCHSAFQLQPAYCNLCLCNLHFVAVAVVMAQCSWTGVMYSRSNRNCGFSRVADT